MLGLGYWGDYLFWHGKVVIYLFGLVFLSSKRSSNVDLYFFFSIDKFHSSKRKPSIFNASDFLF